MHIVIPDLVRNLHLDSSRFTNNAAEEFGYRPVIKRSGVHLPQSRKYEVLPIGIAARHACGLFQDANLDGKPGTSIEEPEEFPVYLVNLGAPIFDVHGGDPFDVNGLMLQSSLSLIPAEPA
ncbi:MAG TPA: hypothetical protein VGW76_17945 [Pyrinomonadaceae bacterium]|nr:hypothetical protein [Pyrinomonadaceae bacterium]